MPKRPFCDAIKIQEINVEIQHSNLYKISEEYDLASPSIRVQTFGITKHRDNKKVRSNLRTLRCVRDSNP